jgi:hypothetical protein
MFIVMFLAMIDFPLVQVLFDKIKFIRLSPDMFDCSGAPCFSDDPKNCAKNENRKNEGPDRQEGEVVHGQGLAIHFRLPLSGF